MSLNSTSKQNSSTGGKNVSKNWLPTSDYYSNMDLINAPPPVTMAKLNIIGGNVSYNHGGPMPNLINLSEGNLGVSISDRQIKSNINNHGNQTSQLNQTVTGGVGMYNFKENMSTHETNSIINNPQNASLDTNTNVNQKKSTIDFIPFKCESFEKIIKNTTDGRTSKTIDDNLSTKDSLSKNKSSSSKHSKKHSSNISKESERKRKDVSNTAGSKSNKLIQRAIERSKNDMGMLKPRTDIPPIVIPKELHGIRDLNGSAFGYSDEERSFMPKRVQRLLSSGSEGSDDEQIRKQIAEINSLALAAQATASIETLNNSDTNKKSDSKKSRKRKKAIDDISNSLTNSISNNHNNTEDTCSSKEPIVDPKGHNTDELLQCCFVDGLNGRCNNKGPNMYCKKHEKIIRDVEFAFDNMNDDDVPNLNPNQDNHHLVKSKEKSKKNKSSSRKKCGLTIENRDLLLSCLEKIKQLEIQEESLTSKSRLVYKQIQSLNHLRSNFDKQRCGISDEKIRIVDMMVTLLNSWSPLFRDVNEKNNYDDGFNQMIANQQVVDGLLSQLNETEPKDNTSYESRSIIEPRSKE